MCTPFANFNPMAPIFCWVGAVKACWPTKLGTWKPNFPEKLSARENRRGERQLKYAQAKVRLREMGEMEAFAAVKNLVGTVATKLDDAWRHLRWKLQYRSELKSGN